MIKIRDSPTCRENQPVYSLHLCEIDLVYSVGWLVIVCVNTREIKNDRNSVLGVVVVVRTVIKLFRIALVIVSVIKPHPLRILVGLLADLVQFRRQLVG